MNFIEANALKTSNPWDFDFLDFEDKEFSSYIYGVYFACINLERKELDADFLRMVFSESDITTFANIYLNFLDQHNHQKFESLKDGEGFDLQKVLEDFSKEVKGDFQEYGVVFHINKARLEDKYKNKTPIDDYLEKPYFKNFCDNLELSKKERILLLLACYNHERGWLFPSYKEFNYKANILNTIFNLQRNNIKSVRAMNNKFIELGIFSEPWHLNNYVYEFFKHESSDYVLMQIPPDANEDIYEYEDLEQTNREAMTIMIKEEENFSLNYKGCWQVLTGSSEHRNKRFLSYLCDRRHTKLFVINPRLLTRDLSLNELKFYIFAYCTLLKNVSGLLFLDSNVMKFFEQEPGNGHNVIRIVNGNAEERITDSKNSPILKYVNKPVFISLPELSAEKKQQLAQHGMDILFSAKLKLPAKDLYFHKAMLFFFENGVPEKFLKPAVDECKRLNVSPEKWKDIVNIAKNSLILDPEEMSALLINKFTGADKNNGKVRKNSHYSFKALNTSEPIEGLVEALRNADAFQNGEYDNDSGIRVLAYGESGTGKTACVEEISKMLNKPLEIIRASDILSSYVGQTEQNIKSTFEKAASEHAVLLIDEADSFLHSRGDTVNRHNDTKVNEFLIQMERYPGILFCNTNLPEVLDDATSRRFHFKVGFKPLTKDGIEVLWNSYFTNYQITQNEYDRIYESGTVTPGDFGTLNGKLRFVSHDKLNADYIVDELCKIIRGKKTGIEKRRMGFELQ